MSRLPAGHYAWHGRYVSASIPWTGDPGPDNPPPDLPTGQGAQGETFYAAVTPFPFPTSDRPATPIVLWGAKVHDLQIRAREVGPNTVTVTAPADPVTMRILGLRLEDRDDTGRHLYDLDPIRLELLVGSNLDGKVRWRFVVRDRVEVDGGMVTINGVGFVGGLSSDVVIGAPERKNLLNYSASDNTPDPRGGSFELGTLAGWTLHSPAGSVVGSGDTASLTGIEAKVVPGGVSGSYMVGLRGVPDAFHYLEKRYRKTETPRPWGQQRIAGSAYFQLPSGVDIDDYGMVTVGVEDASDGTVRWPPGGIDGEDPEAGVVTTDMARGSFNADPVTSYGRLPTPPYDVYVCLRLHPLDETAWTYYDAADLFRRENTSTVTSVDLTKHVKKLWDHAQTPPTKSPKGVRVDVGEFFGKAEVGTWWHEDGQSLDDAQEALAGRGFAIFDKAGPGRVIASQKRRGAIRDDLTIHWWDLCGVVRWGIDPGAQRSALRMTSAANTAWGGSDVGAIDTSHTGGQIIDVIMSAPVGMTPSKLRAYARERLSTLKLPQVTTTLFLPWRLARRISVGDDLTIHAFSNVARLDGSFGVTAWAPDFDSGLVAVDLGGTG